jgi:hypothetical protein
MPYMTVYLAFSLPKTPYVHRIYMVLASPSKTGSHFRSVKAGLCGLWYRSPPLFYVLACVCVCVCVCVYVCTYASQILNL